MKKMIFSAVAFAVVAVSAVAVAPTTSEAIPAFARQTGASCYSCHFQSFPTLNTFGRAFKVGAFTDMGEQALIEDTDLSLPVVVNMSAVLRPQFQSVKTTGTAAVRSATIVADQVLLFGARLGTNSGAFIEYDGTFANYQQINSWDLGDIKAGVSIFNTGFGETAGMEVGSTFGQHGGLLGGKTLSASEQISKQVGATVAAASAGNPAGVINNGNIGGVTFFGANDLVTGSVSLITAGAALGGVENGWKLAPSARLFVTPEVGGFELGLGIGFTSGSTGNAGTVTGIVGAPVAGLSLEMKKTMIDFQAQGEFADMEVGVYADWASASASTATTLNLFNSGTNGALKGYSFRTNIKPVHNMVFQAGYGNLKDNGGVGGVDNTQWQVAGEYELYQNFIIALIYNSNKNNVANSTTNTITLDIEALL